LKPRISHGIIYIKRGESEIMKNSKLIAGFFLLVFMFSPIQAKAASEQGFEWGAPIGSRHDYSLSIGGNFTSLFQTCPIDPDIIRQEVVLPQFYVIVMSHIDIVTVSSWSELMNHNVLLTDDGHTAANIEGHYPNDTPILPSQMERIIDYACLPVGNWSFVTELADSVNHTPIESSDSWGLAPDFWPTFPSINPEIKGNQNWTWSKSDGMLDSRMLEYWNTTSETLYSYVYITRESITLNDEPFSIPQLLIATAGVGIALILVISVSLIKKKR